MIETGSVIKLKDKIATVKVDKKDECSKCGMCLFPKNASHVEFETLNQVGAKEGDTVIIESKKDFKLLGAVLTFLIPLLLIGVSALITYFFIGIEIWLLILSVILIILWYTVLVVIDKKLKTKIGYTHIITKIIDEGEKLNE